MKIYSLKAATAEGFGGKAFYTEKITLNDNQDLNFAIMQFALRYNVEFDSVIVSEVE